MVKQIVLPIKDSNILKMVISSISFIRFMAQTVKNLLLLPRNTEHRLPRLWQKETCSDANFIRRKAALWG